MCRCATHCGSIDCIPLNVVPADVVITDASKGEGYVLDDAGNRWAYRFDPAVPGGDFTAEAVGLPDDVSNGLDRAISEGLDALVRACQPDRPDPIAAKLAKLPEFTFRPSMLPYNDPIRIAHNLTHQPPKPGQTERYEKLRRGAIDLSLEFARLCPDSPELESALNGIDDAVRLAIAAIARNEP